MHGLYGYINRNLRGRKGQSGFTLIELLVVVTILGVLAAIVTLSLVGLTTNAQAKACSQEYKTVQAGLDAYMANNNKDSVTATLAAGTSDMTSPILLYNSAPSASSPTYVRNSPTQWAYVWDATGRITKVMQAVVGTGTGPAVPAGCTVSGG
ncbi:MAG TPA: type II secretion system protein [Candidatus Dormibacteraeota bacterium]|nr:type II secretion system protein [Candidatus Dormibacteraeota bacterium]